MNSQARLSASAGRDLTELADFVERTTGDPAHSVAVSRAFINRLDEVVKFPGSCEYAPDPAYADDRGVRHAFFSTPHGRPHRFLYEVVGGVVHVLRVRSSSQDLLR